MFVDIEYLRFDLLAIMAETFAFPHSMLSYIDELDHQRIPLEQEIFMRELISIASVALD